MKNVNLWNEAGTFGKQQANAVSACVDIGICSRHKPKRLSYLEWHDWAEKKNKRGAIQKQCRRCGRWYFREEF